jgi:hypothetical protein
MNNTFTFCAMAIVILTGTSAIGLANKWARVEHGEAQEVFAYRPDFHPDVMRQITECPDTVQPKWRKSGDTWLPPKTPEEMANDAFDRVRARLLALPAIKARRFMAEKWTHRLTGPLESGYPDPTQPMCTNAAGVALTLADFSDYLQERQDGTATPEELQALRQQAKQARQYLKSLKGD